MDIINIIKNSFEEWYNKNVSDTKVSIVINYSDMQILPIKAYHTTTIEMQAVSIRDNESYVNPLVCIKANYNHGVTSEQEAKEAMIGKLLKRLYYYKE